MQKKSVNLHTYRHSVQVLLSFYTVFVSFLPVWPSFVRTRPAWCMAAAGGCGCGRIYKCLYHSVLQKAAFWRLKGGLLEDERRPFATQKAVYCETAWLGSCPGGFRPACLRLPGAAPAVPCACADGTVRPCLRGPTRAAADSCRAAPRSFRAMTSAASCRRADCRAAGSGRRGRRQRRSLAAVRADLLGRAR